MLVDAGDPTIHVATAAVGVADGRWHRLECRRTGTSLTLLVDGAVSGSTTVPATLTVANDAPLSIGGKGPFDRNDQFQGYLDDVWVGRPAA